MDAISVIVRTIIRRVMAPSMEKYLNEKSLRKVTEIAYLRRKFPHAYTDANGCMRNVLLLEFDVNGMIIQCGVPEKVYNQVCEGTAGMLTHKGTNFKCFEVNGVKIKK